MDSCNMSWLFTKYQLPSSSPNLEGLQFKVLVRRLTGNKLKGKFGAGSTEERGIQEEVEIRPLPRTEENDLSAPCTLSILEHTQYEENKEHT